MALTFERFYYNNQDIHTTMVGEDSLILIVLAMEVNNIIGTYIPNQTEMKMSNQCVKKTNYMKGTIFYMC